MKLIPALKLKWRHIKNVDGIIDCFSKFEEVSPPIVILPYFITLCSQIAELEPEGPLLIPHLSSRTG